MTNPLSIIEDFKNYSRHMRLSAIDEKRAVNMLRKICERNNEVNTEDKKLAQYSDRLDNKIEAYEAQLELLDKLENAINPDKQD